MPITDLNAVQQALANVRLESLEISAQLEALLKKALMEGNLNTDDILKNLNN
jgi:hypothetical protein